MIATVAGATFREAVRSRSFLLLLVLYTIAVALSRLMGWISGTDGNIVTANVVGSLQSLIGVLVAVATATALVHNEIQQRTLYTVLSRPLARWHFVAGKFLGLLAALGLGQAAMLLIGLGYLAATGATVHGGMWLAGLLTMLEVWVMAGVGLMWTTLSSPLLAAVLGLATYALGHAVHEMPHLVHHLDGWKAYLAIALGSLVPDLGRFAFRDRAVHGELPLGEDWLAIPYGLLWIAFFLAVSTAVFRRKQL